MRLLFDTHLWVWFVAQPARLPDAARQMLLEPAAEIAWSAASIWEVAIKFSLQRPDFNLSPADLLGVLRKTPFTELDVRPDHVLPLADLPILHRDPFDRLLIAQSISEGFELVTADDGMPAYQAPIRRLRPHSAAIP